MQLLCFVDYEKVTKATKNHNGHEEIQIVIRILYILCVLCFPACRQAGIVAFVSFSAPKLKIDWLNLMTLPGGGGYHRFVNLRSMML